MTAAPPARLPSPTPILSAADPNYLERVYAGVLGKIIGVYLGRPVENWSYERIRDAYGTVTGYVHESRGRNLVVTDDDISGTFTFLRALEDSGFDPALTPAQIGETWLNYLIEGKTILWWGGMGNSTEHTAYLRLKAGIAAPQSGSAHLNTPIIAEQIGAQIFIDGWGLVAPGDPVRAADLARRAASVSHDGEAIHAAVAVAAMVAAAFVESDVDGLLDAALNEIPSDSTIARLIGDVRRWHIQSGGREDGWRDDRERLETEYGYDRYAGNCHAVPNHGLIILSLLHGRGEFDRSLSIVNSCGWDTDCNSGNVGAIVGVLGGLGAIRAEWRDPVADRLYLPSADGGRAITDALREAVAVARAGLRLAGFSASEDRPRFSFALSGSVQGWQARDPETLSVVNPVGDGIRLARLISMGDARASTPTFIPPEAKDVKTGYVLVANPTLYPGHTVVFRLRAKETAARGRLFLTHYNAEDVGTEILGPQWSLAADATEQIEFAVPPTGGQPIYEIGTTLDAGTVEIVDVHWEGVPETEFPPVPGTMWGRAWASSLHRFEYVRDGYAFLTHNEGIGLLTQGHREWRDYRVEATLTPRMAVSAGLAFRVQGLRRYYALLFGDAGEIRLEKRLGDRRILARTSLPWASFQEYEVEIEAKGSELKVWIDGRLKLSAVDSDAPLLEGAFGFVVEAGCLGSGTPRISPV